MARLAGPGRGSLWLERAARGDGPRRRGRRPGHPARLHWSGGLTWHRQRRPGFVEWRCLLREAGAGWLDGLLESGFQRLTMIVAYAVGDERSAGHFFIALNLSMRPNQFLSPATSRVAAVWFHQAENHAARIRGRNRLLFLTSTPLLAAAVVTAAVADPLLPWLLGEAWRRPRPYSPRWAA